MFSTVDAVVESDTVPATVTAVEVRETLTGLATAFVIVEAVVEGVTVPVIVTVLSTVTFVELRDAVMVLSTVTFVDASETLPATVTAVLVKETLTGFPTALVIVEAVEDKLTVPTVILTQRFPTSSTKTGQASAASEIRRFA